MPQIVVKNIRGATDLIEDFLCPAQFGITQLATTFQFGVSFLTKAGVPGRVLLEKVADRGRSSCN
jgi:hypothetical protein